MMESKRARSPLSGFNYRVFVVPAVLMLAGAVICALAVLFWGGNSTLILVGEIIFAVGLFVAILLGFWVMTLVRLPQW
jgi:hypothetical protein